MNNQYQIIRIQRYLSGQLAPEEMYELEREALDNPFLHDAIEGYRLQNEVDHGRLSLLQQRLATRIEGQQEEKNRFYFFSQRLAVAATAAVLFVLVVVLFWMRATMNSAEQQGVIDGEREVFVEMPKEGQTGLVQPLQLSGYGPAVEAQSALFIQGLNTHLQEELNWSVLEESNHAGIVYRLDFAIGDQGHPVGVVLREPATVNESLRTELIKALESSPSWEGGAGLTGSLEISFSSLPVVEQP